MGSRGYRRLFRRARAEIRRRRREAMIGACNDVVAHLRAQVERNHALALQRQMWPGLDGLLDSSPARWPEPLSALFPARGGMTTGTIGGRARTNPLLGTPRLIVEPFMVADDYVVVTDEEHRCLLHKFWRDFKAQHPLGR